MQEVLIKVRDVKLGDRVHDERSRVWGWEAVTGIDCHSDGTITLQTQLLPMRFEAEEDVLVQRSNRRIAALQRRILLHNAGVTGAELAKRPR